MTKVSVIIEDRTIVVDNEGFHLSGNESCWNGIDPDIRAFQYDSNDSSQCSIEKSQENISCTLTDVQVFIDAHTAEKARIQQVEDDFQNSWDRIRQERQNYIFDTDWTQTEDSPLTDAKKEEFRVYRQALRDMTTTYSEVEPRNLNFYEGDVIRTEQDGTKTVVIAKPSTT